MEVIKIRLSLVSLGITSTSLISFLIAIYNFENHPSGYALILIFPIIYLFLYLSFFNISLKKLPYPITMFFFLSIEWLRFVLMPPIIFITGQNAGQHYINPSTDSVYWATFLMIYEIIIGSFFIYTLQKKSIKMKIDKGYLKLNGSKGVYLVYLVFALGVYIYFESKMNLINFGFVSVGTGTRIGDHTDLISVLAQQIILVGMIVLFSWIVDYCARKYKLTKKMYFISISLMIAVINVSIIIGERRSAQLFAAFSSIILLLKVFPNQRKKIFGVIGGTASVIIGIMSIYKFSYAFLYDSYIDALANSNFSLSYLSQILQSYFLGPEIIAMAIDFSNDYNLSLSNMIFDFARSTFPISLLLKSDGDVTSVYFNEYIYSGAQSTGHVLSAMSYGYIYLGPLLAPLIVILNIYIATFFEKRMYISKSYEMTYVWAYLLIRFSGNLFANSPALISAITIMLFSGGLLFFISKLLKIKNLNSQLKTFPDLKKE